MKRILTRSLAVMLALLPLLSLFPSFSTGARADAGGRVPYHYAVDDINGHSVSSTMIGVIRDLHLPLGEALHASGWLATDEGVSGYEYLWLPAGGGIAEWQPVTEMHIEPRPDLAAAGIAYVSGHGTAGFSLTIRPSIDTPEGIYDVYIRALDGMGVPCDVVVLLSLRYGDPDYDDGQKRVVSFPRIRREGDASKVGKPIFDETSITLSGEQMIRLGDLNLAAFARLRITYELETPAPAEGERPILGLKKAGKYGYGTAGNAYNMTDNLLYAALPAGEKQGTLNIDLTACDYGGDVWLSAYLDGSIRITEIVFTYSGYVTDRVAAKINLSGDLVSSYFAGTNRTTVLGVTDPVLGDVLRMEVSEETNDPYAFFSAGALLKENGLLLDADDYKYMVILYRAETCNKSDRMNLYLCSGMITGATEACNQGVSLIRDGKWHYLLVDLSQKENWSGIINGWRFDYISADSDVGDAVEFASVQFFRTHDAALEVASEDPKSREPYHIGDPVVERDMREELGVDEPDYVISPEDIYVVTEPETEAPTEPETEPETNPQNETTVIPQEETTVTPEDSSAIQEPASDPETSSSAETTLPSTSKGCSSAILPLALILVTAMFPIFLKKRNTHKGEHYEA